MRDAVTGVLLLDFIEMIQTSYRTKKRLCWPHSDFHGVERKKRKLSLKAEEESACADASLNQWSEVIDSHDKAHEKQKDLPVLWISIVYVDDGLEHQ